MTPYKDIIATSGLSLDEKQLAQLDSYAQLLREWNIKVNLVSRKDEANIWPDHLLHSLSILFYVKIPHEARVADMGSGGGLPGIPIAIALPQTSIVLIDSIRKKCLALEDMIRRLGLTNVEVLNARAEDIGASSAHNHSFDLILARAVGPLADLIKWSMSLVRSGDDLAIRTYGKEPSSFSLPALIALKGGSMDEEVKNARKACRLSYLESIPIEFKGIENTGLAHKSLLIIGL